MSILFLIAGLAIGFIIGFMLNREAVMYQKLMAKKHKDAADYWKSSLLHLEKLFEALKKALPEK